MKTSSSSRESAQISLRAASPEYAAEARHTPPRGAVAPSAPRGGRLAQERAQRGVQRLGPLAEDEVAGAFQLEEPAAGDRGLHADGDVVGEDVRVDAADDQGR